ncbi:MAG: hypothetical protein HY850_10935 [Betaproteobacteria bacterium]|nr:hypothetical protein [Betaproteobacteria bacterium]
MKQKVCERLLAAGLFLSGCAGMDVYAGTSQAVCNAPAYVTAGASGGSSAAFFLVENQAGTMGASAPGNLVFSLTGNARFRAAKVTGTNAIFAPSSAPNGARVLTTIGNGNAALPAAASGTGQVVFGGVTFSSTYLVDTGADTLVISNDAGVAPTAIDSVAATGGSDLTYGEYLAGLMKAIHSVFAPLYYSAIFPSSSNGSSGLFAYANISAAAPATLTLDPDMAIAGGTSPISTNGGLAAVTLTANAVPSKYIDADSKLAVPFSYAPGTRGSLVAVSNIALDARNMKQGDTAGIQLDPATTTSGVTTGVVTNIASTAISSPGTVIPLFYPTSDCGSIGPLTNRTQVVLMPPVAANDVGKQGKYFVAARLPDGRVYFLNRAGDFVLYAGGDIPEWSSGVLPSNNQYVLVLGNADVSAIVGTKIYAGYGSDADEMARNGTYHLVLTVY